MIVFLTGASGVGKTTIVERLEQTHQDQGFDFYHFDSIGIPSAEEMNAIENWQEVTTHEWIDRLIKGKGDNSIIFEGSTNMQFIKSGFEKHQFDDYLIVLIDCEEASMVKRLIEDRKQAELVSPDMKNWLKYLRRQAGEFSVDIINTSTSTLEQACQILLDKIESAKQA